MPKSKALVDARGEVREITSGDLKRFRPAREALPASLRRKVGVRGPQGHPLRSALPSDCLLKSFNASGRPAMDGKPGWTTPFRSG